jgi:hypothetical protein
VQPLPGQVQTHRVVLDIQAEDYLGADYKICGEEL